MDVSFAVFFALSLIVALSGGVFRPGAWYWALRKPSWQPPPFLFGPVWAALYVMIAASGYLAWRDAPEGGAFAPMAVFGLQLVLNGLWSALFFGMRRMDLALGDIAALWGSIVATMIAFAPINGTAALLLAPYLAWVSFAGFLNLTLLRLNPEARAA